MCIQVEQFEPQKGGLMHRHSGRLSLSAFSFLLRIHFVISTNASVRLYQCSLTFDKR